MQDLNDMLYFAEVVERGGFAAAGRALGIPKSRLSRRVSDLETQLGVRLLQRTTRKLRLSEGGEEVFKRCQEMVNAARSVMEISGQFTHEAEGLVRVSVPKAVGRYVVHPHMPEFLRRRTFVRSRDRRCPHQLAELSVMPALRRTAACPPASAA